MFPIVLASQSPARIALFQAIGIRATGVRPDVDEATIVHADPRRLAALRASAKARSIRAPGACVIGADQVAWMNGETGLSVFGKPTDPGDHLRRLLALRGRRHTLTTAVSIVHAGSEVLLSADSHLLFRGDLSDDELAAYVATGEGSACAGGYAVEGLGAQLVAAIDGDYTNVLGMPVPLVIDALRRLGWRPTFV